MATNTLVHGDDDTEILQFNLTNPEQLTEQLKHADLDDQETDVLLKEAMRINAQLKEALRSQQLEEDERRCKKKATIDLGNEKIIFTPQPTPAHPALADCQFLASKNIDLPLYSPNLAPYDFLLFLKPKNASEGYCFESVVDIQRELQGYSLLFRIAGIGVPIHKKPRSGRMKPPHVLSEPLAPRNPKQSSLPPIVNKSERQRSDGGKHGQKDMKSKSLVSTPKRKGSANKSRPAWDDRFCFG